MSDSSIAIVAGAELADYHLGDAHAFGPRRHQAFMDGMEKAGLIPRVTWLDPVRCDEQSLRIFHSDEYIEKIQGGWLEFDKAIATPDMMSSVSKLGRVLGPRGMMPNAKLGTVTFDIQKAVNEIKAGKIDFKVEKTGIVHAPVGRVSFGREKLLENISAFIETIMRLKPPSSKGSYLRSIAISTTMGPGVKVDPGYVKDLIH